MKKVKSPILMAAAALVASIGVAVAGAGLVKADSNTTNSNPMNSLITAISTKFNLNQSDVAQVFEEQHVLKQAEQLQNKHAKKQAKLAEAVTSGELTQDQADKLTVKMQELQAQREANKSTMADKTQEERRAFKDEQRSALTQWATDNNIPEKFVIGRGGPGRGHGGPHNFNGSQPSK